MMVVCNKAKTCKLHLDDVKRGFGCGGAIPHSVSSCDPCEIDLEAKCVPVENTEISVDK